MVPAGSFTMGSTGFDEGPEHIVTIGRPFAVGRLHVTVDQYAAGSFEANGFGLSDMLGNAWQHTEDCYNESYQGAPADGSPWTEGDCGQRVDRGGSWLVMPLSLRAAKRDHVSTPDDRVFDTGFRVARTLVGP